MPAAKLAAIAPGPPSALPDGGMLATRLLPAFEEAIGFTCIPTLLVVCVTMGWRPCWTQQATLATAGILENIGLEKPVQGTCLLSTWPKSTCHQQESHNALS